MSGFYEPPPGSASPFRERLLRPQWDLVEQELGRPVPGILRELYGDPSNLLHSHFRVAPPEGGEPRWLDLFFPLDQEALRPYGLELPPGAIAFADDEHGDPYFFIPDSSAYGDGPVYVLQASYGGGARELVASSLAEFLRWPREYT